LVKVVRDKWGVDYGDKVKHGRRNDQLFVKRMMKWMTESDHI